MNLLSVENLQLWRAEQHVLRGVSFDVAAGGCLVVTGANGAGKSTLLRALAGLIPLEQGTVRWRGVSVAEDRYAYCADLRFLGHDNGLKGDLTARENLRYCVNLPAHTGRDAIDVALGRSGIDADEPQLVRQMSAGQRRRVALAGLSLSAGMLWLLDEPTSHLDTSGQQLVESLLAEHMGAGGVAVIATHQALAVPAPMQVMELS